MTSRAPVSAELLHAALIDLLIAAAPFRAGRGMSLQRAALAAAIVRTRGALDAATVEAIGCDWTSLRKLAEQADREAHNLPGYRADLNG